MAERPTRFAPVVLAGLLAAVLAAVTSARAWIRLDLPASARVGLTDADLRADSPLALALALVALAGWGVVLVSRRRGRRIVLVLALLADLGVIICVVRAPATLPGQLRDQLSLGQAGSSAPTAAYWIAAVAALAGVLAAAAGLRFSSRWPEMSSRYDAPATATAAPAPHGVPAGTQAGTQAGAPAGAPAGTQLGAADEEIADLELWKALDQGHDPTAG